MQYKREFRIILIWKLNIGAGIVKINKSGDPVLLLFKVLLVLTFLSIAYDELQVFLYYVFYIFATFLLQVLVQQHVAVTVVKLKWIESFRLEIFQHLLFYSFPYIVSLNVHRPSQISVTFTPLLQLLLRNLLASWFNYEDGTLDLQRALGRL